MSVIIKNFIVRHDQGCSENDKTLRGLTNSYFCGNNFSDKWQKAQLTLK